MDTEMKNIRNFKKQNNRKQIDTFVNINESRFEPIEKSPNVLTNVKKVTGLNFKGYKERTGLFPEKDIATFYNANKEATMKGLTSHALPWQKMTAKEAADIIINETPEDSYDQMKATETQT